MVRMIHGQRAFSLVRSRRRPSVIAGLAADRRGVTAMFFAVIAVSLLGFVSLATEVGTWYLTRSAADNAADASAIAAALVVAANPSTPGIATDAATDTASDNGYKAGGAVTVAPSILAATGSNPNSPAQVLINVTVTPILASLFGSGTPTVASQSVAIVGQGNPVCALSTTGDLVIMQPQGSESTASINCTYASNASDSTAVNITGGATIDAYGVTSVGSCFGCGNSGNFLLRPAASYQPPTINPYTAIDQLTLPTPTQNSEGPLVPDGSCQYGQSLTVSGPYSMVPTTANGTFNAHSYPWTTGQPYFAYEDMCLNIQAGATVTMVPGTYIFYNASLSVTGGSITCVVSLASSTPCTQAAEGVTIIFMGNPSASVGNLTITSSATVNLGAPASQAYFGSSASPITLPNSSAFGSAYTALNGILFYRRSYVPTHENASTPGVNISGGASTLLNGGLYFPASYVSYGANGTTAPTCSVIVAAYLTMANAPSQFNSGNCQAPYNLTTIPYAQIVQVVE
jgi:Flp pilus assembly protein TadG